jgi:hypothetical protein
MILLFSVSWVLGWGPEFKPQWHQKNPEKWCEPSVPDWFEFLYAATWFENFWHQSSLWASCLPLPFPRSSRSPVYWLKPSILGLPLRDLPSHLQSAGDCLAIALLLCLSLFLKNTWVPASNRGIIITTTIPALRTGVKINEVLLTRSQVLSEQPVTFLTKRYLSSARWELKS